MHSEKDSINYNLVELAYQLFTRVKDSDFEYIYRGGFSQKISKNLLSLAESNVKNTAGRTDLKNRIYFVMVEGLQNITKHGDEPEAYLDIEDSGMFAIQRKLGKYYITTGNVINKESERSLKPKLDQLNILEKDQLNKLRKEVLVGGELSDKGGAGLGLIEMARKSGKKLVYEFEPVDDKASFFYFRTEIQGEQSLYQESAPSIVDDRSIEDVKSLHKKLNEENVLINFNGKFNRENILSILSVIKGQMNISSTSKKVYGIMVEMLQNISKHTNNIEENIKNRGIFFLSKKDNKFILTSGNYIHNSDIDGLVKKIDGINNLSAEDLYEQYNSVLLDITPSEKKTGLGFIDIKIKSENKIIYYFKEIDNNFSFFALQSTIQIKD
jgi:hypothetical protein